MRKFPDIAMSQSAQKISQHGVALLAVLWLVAALSVMLIGMQHAVRGEIRIASQLRNGVVGNGIADAAIRLTLQGLASEKNKSIKSPQTKTVLVFGNEVKVEVIPLNGYVDLNSAPLSLLADAFEYAGGVSKETAQRLAANAVDARNRKSVDGTPARFHAVEDLLLLAGVDYPVYAKMKSCLTAEIVGSGRINPLAASVATLVILAKGDLARAQQLFASSLSNPDAMDTTSLAATHMDIAPTTYLTIRATTLMQDKTGLERTWRVDVSSSAYGLPWRVLSVDQTVVADTRISN